MRSDKHVTISPINSGNTPKNNSFTTSQNPMTSRALKKKNTIESSIRKQEPLSLSSLHQIINKSSFMALRKQIKGSLPSFSQEGMNVDLPLIVLKEDSSTNIRVMGCMQNCHNLPQLWTILPDNIKKGEFYIIHTESNLALEFNEHNKVYLARRERKKQQFFTLEKMKSTLSIYDDFIFIKCLGTKKALALTGVLKLVDPNDKSQLQQFYLKKVDLYKPKKLSQTFIIADPNQKGYCISVDSEASEVVNYRIVDFSLFQRWEIVPFRNLQKNIRKISCHQIPEEAQNEEQEMKRDQSGKENEEDNVFNELPQKEKNVLANIVKKSISQRQQDDAFQLINYSTQRSLTVDGDNNLVMKKCNGEREWRVKYDGYSMSIEHIQKKKYIDVSDMNLKMSQNPKLWEKTVSKEHNFVG